MITDGTFVCGLCGEWLAGCSLCGTAPLVDRRETLAREQREQQAAENELWLQERCIRDAAERRRGEDVDPTGAAIAQRYTKNDC